MDSRSSWEEHVDDVKTQMNDLRNSYKELVELKAQVRKLESQCSSKVKYLQSKVVEVSVSVDSKRATELKGTSEHLQEMSTSFPRPPSTILKLVIGDINVTLFNRDDKNTYKQEYEKFKMFNTITILILSLISVVFPDYFIPGALVHCVSVWHYFTITLRELILLSNGSKIKRWWLMHHYLSIAIATLLLTWPPGVCYSAFKVQFMLFTCCLSFVMALQFRYQRAKFYKTIAMGRRHHMSVSQESSMAGLFDFTFLIICLCGIYLFQFFNSYTLITMYLGDPDCSYWQVPVVGVLFFILGLFNSLTLSSVISAKVLSLSKSKKLT